MDFINTINIPYAVGCFLSIIFLIVSSEYLRGRLALIYGDNTAQNAGKLSFNPIKHICPIGTILVPISSFFISGFPCGWARPIPINYNNINKKNSIILALSAPLFLLAFTIICFIGLKNIEIFNGINFPIESYFNFVIQFSLTLLIFNLLPIYPMPVARALQLNLSTQFYSKIQIPKRVGQGILLVIILTGLIGHLMIKPLLAAII